LAERRQNYNEFFIHASVQFCGKKMATDVYLPIILARETFSKVLTSSHMVYAMSLAQG